MTDTAIVTCFYSKLHGTVYGGRPGRTHHYLHSLLSLLKISNADFFIYCDPQEEDMLKEQLKDVERRIRIIPYSLEKFYMKSLFDSYKNLTEVFESDRCQEIQYLKTYWMSKIHYDWVFWIDVGISYTGLIPNKYLIYPEDRDYEYYNSSLFCNELVEGLKKSADDKLLVLCVNNILPVNYRVCNLQYYPGKKDDDISYHTIAGIFGGKKNVVYKFHEMFYNTSTKVIITEQKILDEECIYNILWYAFPKFFNFIKFETWWHEDNAAGHNPNNADWLEYIKSIKSFYNVLEELITLGKEK